jgi:antitoxin component YwqK of YwqJK toxin-antitoxin module
MSAGIQELYYPDGTLQMRTYYDDNNQPHREDGPAIEEFYKNGAIKHRTWYIRGKQHRDDGPAHEWFRKNGTLSHHTWYNHGKTERIDGPIEERFYKDGNLLSRVWSQNSITTKTTGLLTAAYYPNGVIARSYRVVLNAAEFNATRQVYEEFYETGAPKSREWFYEHKPHREDGPADERFSPSGHIISTAYYLDGEGLSEAKYRRRVALRRLTIKTKVDHEVLL